MRNTAGCCVLKAGSPQHPAASTLLQRRPSGLAIGARTPKLARRLPRGAFREVPQIELLEADGRSVGISAMVAHPVDEPGGK